MGRSLTEQEQRESKTELREIAAFSAHHDQKARDSMRPGLAERMVLGLIPHDRRQVFAPAGLLGQLYE